MKSIDWQPSANLSYLKSRAQIIQKIREFFAMRDVLEVETPLLCQSTTLDPYIASFSLTYKARELFLQTSPEFAMKRLLAADIGSIYQICKAFRQEEQGRRHNIEFTMLEWYRVGFDHHQLMNEVDNLLKMILNCLPAQRLSYQTVFEQFLALNPHTCTLAELRQCATQHGINEIKNSTKDDWLNLLFSHLIEPQLGFTQPVFIYDFPASQAALAKIRQKKDFAVAERFEVFVNGMELANGFHELTDATEQQQRLLTENAERASRHLPMLPMPEHLLAALVHGLPACAGIALGIDRLVMIVLKAQSIDEVISFMSECA